MTNLGSRDDPTHTRFPAHDLRTTARPPRIRLPARLDHHTRLDGSPADAPAELELVRGGGRRQRRYVIVMTGAAGRTGVFGPPGGWVDAGRAARFRQKLRELFPDAISIDMSDLRHPNTDQAADL